MDLPSSHEVTSLLKAWSSGDEQALEKANSIGLQAITPGCAPVHGGGTLWPHTADDSTGQ